MQHHANGTSRRHSMPLDPMDILIDQSRALGRIEGTLESHGERLDRIETRSKPSLPYRDMLPFFYGIAVLLAAAAQRWDIVQNLAGKH